jgi:hypothetical protein
MAGMQSIYSISGITANVQLNVLVFTLTLLLNSVVFGKIPWNGMGMNDFSCTTRKTHCWTGGIKNYLIVYSEWKSETVTFKE